MSFGGSVLAMIQSLRANARSKHKAYEGWEKNEKQAFSGSHKLKFKAVSKLEYERYKKKTKAKIEKEQRRLFWEKLLVVVLIPIIATLVFYLFFNAHNTASQQTAPVETENANDIEQVNYLLNSGYEWLNKNHYKNARFQFNRVLKITAESKNGFYGLAASYVYECVLDSTNCEKATTLINEYISKYGSDQSIIYLDNILREKGRKEITKPLPSQFPQQ